LRVELFQEAIAKGVVFFKICKKERKDVEKKHLHLHCSNGSCSTHHLSAFYVKAITFQDGRVHVQMNSNCSAMNDHNREETNPIYNPSTNAAISTHRAAGGCSTGFCSNPPVDGELYCEYHLAEKRRREAEKYLEVSL